jgi:hypothetical protein
MNKSCEKKPTAHSQNILHVDVLYKINRILPLPQGNHAVKFDKDPIYRNSSYHAETTLLSKILFIVTMTRSRSP